jgi:hypothetical protein
MPPVEGDDSGGCDRRDDQCRSMCEPSPFRSFRSV